VSDQPESSPANAELTRISKDHINSMPLWSYEGPTVVVRDDANMAIAAAALAKEPVLGFDTESRPSFRRGDNFPVSVLQLAASGQVFVIQLATLTDPSPVLDVLANPALLKVGIALHDDIRKMQEWAAFKPAGFVEIADFTQKFGILNTGLRSLAAHFLQIRISKRAQVSNWARRELTAAQIQYAATDAWVSRQLFITLQHQHIIPETTALRVKSR
jgi:ribonuclease D